jgi:hypothetical protein
MLEERERINKKAVIADYLPWILIAVAVLVILMITIAVLRERGVSLIDQLKSFFGG